MGMKIVCFADTHSFHKKIVIPDGDILIFAGDMSNVGSEDEVRRFGDFFSALPHKYKIVIAGNHDWLFQINEPLARWIMGGIIYLKDSSVEIKGIKIYGFPWTPEYQNWAFNVRRDRLYLKMDIIPEDVDILITHGPPNGIMDRTHNSQVGCSALLSAIKRIKPVFHIYGHIHECYGTIRQGKTTFVNASICDEHYLPRRPAIILNYHI